MNDGAFEDAVRAIVAETFSIPLETIVRETTADDVAGWDSLGHSILLTRLSRKFAVDFDDDFAAYVRDVGELSDALAKVVLADGRSR